MKKVLYLLVTIFMLTLFNSNVYASSFTITLDGESTFNDEISLDILVNNLNGFTDGFYGLDATLSYDKSKIELKEITAASSSYNLTYDKTVNDRFVILTGNGVNNGTKLATVIFKNKGLSSGENVTISLTNLIGSDGEEDVTISGTTTKTVTYSETATMKGDMNKNSKIDLSDIITLLRVYLNDDATAEQLQIGDMDNNGSIGLNDIISLLRLYLNS